MASAAKKLQEQITLEELDLCRAKITLVGSSSLICHRFGDSAKQKMRDKHAKRGDAGRPVRDTKQEFLDSLYMVRDGKTPVWGFPAIAFKGAAVSACRNVQFTTMTAAKGSFHIDGQPGVHGTLVPIVSKSGPRMREDAVRVGMNGVDLRYRAEFLDWQVSLDVQYNASVLSLEQLVHLFQVAGFAVGVGEWRPSSPKKPGPHGRWEVKRG